MKIFSLCGGVKINKDVLGKDFVYGVSIRPGWKSMEVGKNVFDWSEIDKPIESALKKGKKVFFRTMVGPSCPKYIFDDPKIPKVSFFSSKSGRKITLPVPWNERYLERYYILCDKLSSHLTKIPGVEMIAISGAADGAANPFLEKDGMDAYIKAGYTSKIWTQTWKTMIDKHLTYFKGKKASLCCDCADGQISEDLAFYAREKYRKGKLITLQSNGLNGRPGFLDDPRIEFLYDYIGRIEIGFQMTWWSGDRLGPMDVAIKNGLTFGAKYLEIYEVDILNPKYNKLFKSL